MEIGQQHELRIRICRNCGREFVKLLQGKGGFNKAYCSDKCRREWAQRNAIKQSVCLYCGKSYETARRRQKYCSSECGHLAQRKLKGTSRICVICGNEFEPMYQGQQCCGEGCARQKGARTQRKPRTHYCRFCGKIIERRRRDRTDKRLYCSRECAFADKAKKCKTCGKVITGSQSDYCSDECKAKAVYHEIKCIVCGKVFRGKNGAKYCSDECRKEKARHDARTYAETKHKLANKQIKCKHCGREFEPEYGTKRRQFCSDFCLKKYSKRIEKAVRRARIKGHSYELFDPIEIFERDKWRCQLCGRKTPKSLRGTTDDRAPELDHIVPLALGGSHTRANTQCVCRRCNQKKRATVQGQLRLF